MTPRRGIISQHLLRGRPRQEPSPTNASGNARAHRPCHRHFFIGEIKSAELAGASVSVVVAGVVPGVTSFGDNEHTGKGVGPVTRHES